MLSKELVSEQDRRISETIERERLRLWSFIRKRVADFADAEDILQEVFYEFVAAARIMEPIEHVSSWLLRVARNRIVDRFRKKRRPAFSGGASGGEHEPLSLEELLPSRDAGPEAAYVRSVLLDELQAGLAELPPDQREAFVAHEIEGRSFKALSSETGATTNALMLRKHQAVVHLRRRLLAVHDYFTKPWGV